MIALEERTGELTRLGPLAGLTVRYCDNHKHDACNWLVEAGSDDTFYLACRQNLSIPDLGAPENLVAWKRLEIAKRRLIYTCLRLGLPLTTRTEDPDEGLGFDFFTCTASKPNVVTGHANGLITIDLAEADDGEREQRRTAMAQPYRTLVGHFRHEVGHWYWDRLAGDGDHLDEVRATFGDDTADYGTALQRHYETGAPADWQERFVSSYATAHAWEDFAVTWAHYLHVVDTLDTAAGYDLRVNVPSAEGGESPVLDFDPYDEPDLSRFLNAWTLVILALNSINRTMGLPDLYPFVLSPEINGKLETIHELIRHS